MTFGAILGDVREASVKRSLDGDVRTALITAKPQVRRVGRLGIEPRTRRLKEAPEGVREDP
jgi:hypothetical protein